MLCPRVSSVPGVWPTVPEPSSLSLDLPANSPAQTPSQQTEKRAWYNNNNKNADSQGAADIGREKKIPSSPKRLCVIPWDGGNLSQVWKD